MKKILFLAIVIVAIAGYFYTRKEDQSTDMPQPAVASSEEDAINQVFAESPGLATNIQMAVNKGMTGSAEEAAKKVAAIVGKPVTDQTIKPIINKVIARATQNKIPGHTLIGEIMPNTSVQDLATLSVRPQLSAAPKNKFEGGNALTKGRNAIVPKKQPSNVFAKAAEKIKERNSPTLVFGKAAEWLENRPVKKNVLNSATTRLANRNTSSVLSRIADRAFGTTVVKPDPNNRVVAPEVQSISPIMDSIHRMGTAPILSSKLNSFSVPVIY